MGVSDSNQVFNSRATKRLRGSPYNDYASNAVPDSLAEIIDWSEFVMTITDEFSTNMRKLYACFNTPIAVAGFTDQLATVDLNKLDKFKLMIEQKLHYSSEVMQVGLNTCTYGSDFVSMTLRHSRSLICGHCGMNYVLKPSELIADLEPRFVKEGFVGRCLNKACPGYGKHRRMNNSDTPVKTEDGIVITHWKWRELEFDYREGFQKLQVYYRVPNQRKKLIGANDIVTLHDTDVGIMEAAVTNKLFLFNEDALFQSKHPQLSGLQLNGIGLPRTLGYIKPHWLYQLLNKQIQVVARDYNNPIPYFTSRGVGGSGGISDGAYGVHDHFQLSNMIQQMVANSRQDPGNMYYIPGDVDYRIAAAGADQLVSDKLLSYAEDRLNSSIIPRALIDGEITHEAAPFWLKFFEAQNVEIPTLYNEFLWWFCSRVATLLGADTVNFMHVPMSVANNPALLALLGQCAASGDIAKSTYLSALNLGYKFEMAKSIAEQQVGMERDKVLQDIQKKDGVAVGVADMAGQSAVTALQGQDPNAQQQGAAMPGTTVQLPSQGYNPPSDAAAMEADAPMLAEAMAPLTDAQRRHELQILASKSTAMHQTVLKALKDLRNTVDRENRAQTHPTL